MKDKSVLLDTLRLGVCYYPEHWSKNLWEEDLQRMKQHGISFIRVFEFAWSFVEPQENVYTFDLFDGFLESARRHDMKIIFCTPTATPPAWLTEKYPDVLNARKNGELLRHGHRRHYNYNSETYLTFTKRIVTKLAQRYQNEKCIIGWQIDNEINGEINEFYSKADHTAFREYLKNRFASLKDLNNAIGAPFWNQTFSDWSQVTMECETPSGHGNPHLELLEKEFFSESANRYVALQASIIRKYVRNAFITTNGLFAHVDNVRMTQESLDFMTYDSYPNMAYECSSGNQLPSKLFRDRLWSKHLECVSKSIPTRIMQEVCEYRLNG